MLASYLAGQHLPTGVSTPTLQGQGSHNLAFTVVAPPPAFSSIILSIVHIHSQHIRSTLIHSLIKILIQTNLNQPNLPQPNREYNQSNHIQSNRAQPNREYLPFFICMCRCLRDCVYKARHTQRRERLTSYLPN